jgi:hypothetical protein
VEEEPFRPAAGVVLLRSEAEEEAQLRIREEAVGGRLGLSVEEADQQSRRKGEVRRLCFCVEARVRAVPVVLPVGLVSRL